MGLRSQASRFGLAAASIFVHRRIHRSAQQAGYVGEALAATMKVLSLGMPILGLGLAAAYLLIDNPEEERS